MALTSAELAIEKAQLERDARIAKAFANRGQAGASERFNVETRQAAVTQRESDLNPTPQYYRPEDILGSDREAAAAKLRAQAAAARETAAEKRRRGKSNKVINEQEEIARRSEDLAARIEANGFDPSDNSFRRQLWKARYPELSGNELARKYLTGADRREVLDEIRANNEAEAAGYDNATDMAQAQAAAGRQEAIDQRNTFLANDRQIPGAFGRYATEQGYNPTTTQTERQNASIALIKSGNAKLIDPITGRAYQNQGNNILVTTRTSAELEAERNRQAMEAARTGRADYQDTSGKLFTTSTTFVSNPSTPPSPQPTPDLIRKVVYKDTVLADPLRKFGGFLAASGQAYYETPGPTAQKIQQTPYIGAATDIFATGIFNLGVRLERQPDREAGQLLALGIGSNYAGKFVGLGVSELGKISAISAVRTERTLQAVGVGTAVVQTVRDPEGTVSNLPAIVVGATQFSKGYRATNPEPIVELGEPRFQSTGTIASAKTKTVLGQYAEGTTPTKVTQFNQIVQTQSPTKAYIRGSNEVTDVSFKSSITTTTDVRIPGREPQLIRQSGNIISGDVEGRQFQLLGVKDQPAKLLVFEENPIFSVSTGSKPFLEAGNPSPIAQQGTLSRTLTIDDATGTILKTQSGFSKTGTIETNPRPQGSLKTALLSPEGKQTEFGTDVLPGPALQKPGVTSKLIKTALELGRREGIIPTYKDDIVYGLDVLTGAGGIGKKGQASIFPIGKQPTGLGPSPTTFNSFRDIPQILPTTVTTISRQSPIFFATPNSNTAVTPINTPDTRTPQKPDIQPIQKSLPSQIPEQLPSTIPAQIPSQIPKQVPKQIPKQIPEQVPQQIPKQIPKQIPEQVPQQIPKQIPKQIPEATPRPSLLEPTNPLIPPRFNNKEDVGSPLFDVEVRRQGQFRTFTTQGLRLEDAVRLGETIADTTAARSFKIVERGTGQPISGAVRAQAQRLTTPGRYREAKRDKNIFVERSRYAINTPGERLEITSKRGIFGDVSGKSPFGPRNTQ